MFEEVLTLLIVEASDRRNSAHGAREARMGNAGPDYKRALATVVTKLEEAMLWNAHANSMVAERSSMRNEMDRDKDER